MTLCNLGGTSGLGNCCSQTCVDTSSDAADCGSCGSVCASQCLIGACL
jgi:hypothetical protein